MERDPSWEQPVKGPSQVVWQPMILTDVAQKMFAFTTASQDKSQPVQQQLSPV